MGIVPTIDEEAKGDKVEVPWGFDSNFGEAPYLHSGTIETDAKSYMLSVITRFSNMDGLRSTPQNEFSRGISEFIEEG